ncbi:MAG TPA: recombinase family protein [Bacillota bacterium]|nr:recombinase family protein [Bacillota bacterium]
MRVGIYGRVSTEEQAKEGYSIAAQKEKLTAYAQSQDWEICDYYIDEGISAKDTDRPELQRLLSDVKEEKIEVVLVYKLDRLTRSVLDLYRLLQEFEQYHVKFKSATEVYDTTTAIGRLFITLVAALAQWERENLAERVKFGQEQMVYEQQRPGGRAPFGFETFNGTLVINEQEAPTVNLIFQKYIDGAGFDGIAIELNNLNIWTKKGNEWNKTGVKRILENPVYYGALRWNYAKGGHKVNTSDEWIILEDVYPAIIEKNTFLKAKQVMESRSLKHPRELASDFIFSGSLRCYRCGGSLSGKTMRVGRGSFEKKYYICKNTKMKKCHLPLIREDYLELVFLDHILELKDERQATLALKTRHLVDNHVDKKALEMQLLKLGDKRKRWQLLFAEGLIELNEFRERIQEDRNKENQLKSQLNKWDEKPSLTHDQILKLLQDIALVWKFAKRDEKKQLVFLLVGEITVDLEGALKSKREKNQVIIKSVVFK